MKAILYSTDCPKCKVLEAKLIKNNIQFTVITDVKTMLAKGFASAPMLEVDGNLMDFTQANKWINEQE